MSEPREPDRAAFVLTLSDGQPWTLTTAELRADFAADIQALDMPSDQDIEDWLVNQPYPPAVTWAREWLAYWIAKRREDGPSEAEQRVTMEQSEL